jgi:cellulose synthase/poly-beta-1,6-N-acetylglucosamine synthase-like glycosyltransferase
MMVSPQAVHATRLFLAVADQVILIYFVALNSFYALLVLLSIPEIWRHWQVADDDLLRNILGSEALPPLSILAPAYNEGVTINASTLSFLTLQYPRHEVIVINDGSRDETLSELIREYDLYPVPPTSMGTIATKPVRGYYRSRRFAKLVVVDKENGGKADSLNAGLNTARYPYVLAVDADTLVEPDALMRLTRPLLLGRRIAAVGGTIRVANACRIEYGRVVEASVSRHWLPGVQTVEYLRAFLFGRLGWNTLGGNMIISGAFGLFRREYLFAIGGYRTSTVGEDMDLVVRLRLYLAREHLDDEVQFIPDPVAWTEVPTSTKVLSRQRERWHRGLIDILLQNWRMMLNPRYGAMGLIAYPYFFFGEMLSPVVEVAGYVLLVVGLLLGNLDPQFAPLFLLCAIAYGALLSFWAIVLEEFTFRRYQRRTDVLRLCWYAVVEPFGYRQMNVWFRLKAFWKYLRSDHSWGTMTRQGFGPPPAK